MEPHTGRGRSVSLAFAVLRVIAREGRALTLSDIARASSTSPSSCLNLLRTLVVEGVIVVEASKHYTLAPGWQAVSGLLETDSARFIARAQPVLGRFAETHDVTLGLWRREPRDRLSLIAIGESAAATRIHMMLGQRQPIGSGSLGRALAAYESPNDDEIARRFASVRWQRPLTLSDYKAQIGEATRHGYAMDTEFAYAGIVSLACVLPATPVRFCLSASLFAGSRDDREIAALGLALTALSAEMTLMAKR